MEASHASSPSEQLFQFWSVSFCTCLWRGIEMLIRFGEWGGIFQHCSEEFQEWGAHTWHGLLCRCLARQRKQQGIHGWGLASQIAQWVSSFFFAIWPICGLFFISFWSIFVSEWDWEGWDKLTSCVQDSRFSSGYCGSHQGSQCTGLALKKTQEWKLHFHASNLKMMETSAHKAEASHISWAYPFSHICRF